MYFLLYASKLQYNIQYDNNAIRATERYLINLDTWTRKHTRYARLL